jgi:Leucine-rich repeat (LRR) protein
LIDTHTLPLPHLLYNCTERNDLSGTIPDEITALSTLKSLDVFVNRLGGTIPRELNSISGLEFLDMEENSLEGPAFVDISDLSNLTSYRVSLNKLTGRIPTEGFTGLASLRELWFARNKVVGQVPPSIGQLGSLGTSVRRNSERCITRQEANTH